jgi:hypothetical protein
MTWKTISIALAIAGTAVALKPMEAKALPDRTITRYYFSDPGKHNMVGEKLVQTCWSHPNQLLWGIATSYYINEYEDCPAGPG